MKIQQVIITGKEEVGLYPVEIDETKIGPNQLLIESEVGFISAGTELANYTATTKEVYVPGSWCAYPWKSGYANVGTVLQAGEKYAHLIGQRVYTNAYHASTHIYSPDNMYRPIAVVPEGVPSEEAVSLRMGMVAMAGLDGAKPQYVRTVVVFGLGMVGNIAAQLFRLTGAKVIGVDPSATRRRMALECGIPHTISGTAEEITAQVKQINGGQLADVTVDAVGNSSIIMQAIRLTASGGEVIILGSPRTEETGSLTEVFSAAHYRWVTIKGCLEWNVPIESPVAGAYTQHKKLNALFDWLADGRLKVKPMLTHVMPPKEIKAAYEGLLRKKEEYVGVVLRWK